MEWYDYSDYRLYNYPKDGMRFGKLVPGTHMNDSAPNKRQSGAPRFDVPHYAGPLYRHLM